MTAIIVGYDTRLDASGREHAWRMVLLRLDRPRERVQVIGSLPEGAYVGIPRDPVWGDLLRNGPPVAESIPALAAMIAAAGLGVVHMASHRCALAPSAAFIASGLDILPYDMQIPEADGLTDRFSVGGHAGHEIAMLANEIGGAR